MPVMMQCGHAANATLDGRPACAICTGRAEAVMVDPVPPLLEGRIARCAQCGLGMPSDTALPFFEHRPLNRFDRFYCGCQGDE